MSSSESGEQITEPGRMGEIVATGFNNYAMPLIRYRTGDMGVWAEGPCPCGREYPRLERIEGRKQELVITSDGAVVTLTGLIFGQHFHAFARISRMQLVQEAVGELTIRIVPANGYCASEDEVEIRTKIWAAVGHRLELDFDYVERIPQADSGKHLFLLQHLPVEEYLG